MTVTLTNYSSTHPVLPPSSHPHTHLQHSVHLLCPLSALETEFKCDGHTTKPFSHPPGPPTIQPPTHPLIPTPTHAPTCSRVSTSAAHCPTWKQSCGVTATLARVLPGMYSRRRTANCSSLRPATISVVRVEADTLGQCSHILNKSVLCVLLYISCKYTDNRANCLKIVRVV